LSLPLYVAESQGYFAAEGAKVVLKEVIGGNRAMQQVLDGVTDLATVSETVVMFHSFKRNDFAVIASFATTTGDVDLITGKALGNARPEQLAGKRIGTVIGSASHYYGDSWLIFHGGYPRSTRPVSLQPETMASALANGEVDAVAIWNPFSFEILKTVPGARQLPNPGTYRLSFNLIAARKLLGPRDDELASVLRAVLRAEQFIQADPAKAQTILRERLTLNQEFIDWILPKYQYRVTLVQPLIVALESAARWARSEGHVAADRSSNYLGFIYAQPMRKAQPDRVRIGK
jgi:NitT/TauT family transport system substrate-binding protein